MTRWLYLPGWICRVVQRPAKRAAIHTHDLVVAHQHYRRARRFKRAAMAWTCIATGGIGAAIVPPLFTVPSAMPAVVGTSAPPAEWPCCGIGLDTLPPVTGWEIIGPPVLLPETPIAPGPIAPPTLAPEIPTTPLSVPEPSSALLLATAVAAMAWRLGYGR